MVRTTCSSARPEALPTRGAVRCAAAVTQWASVALLSLFFLCTVAVAQPPLCQSDNDCDDGNACTTDECDPGASGANASGCVLTPVADGTSCTDGDVCNGNETCQSGVCVHGNPGTCTVPGAIVFDLKAPTAGTVAYNGTGGPLTGSGIQVDEVRGVGTVANDGVIGDCVGCTLTFTTGPLKSTGPNTWTFHPGGAGSFRVTGAIDLDRDGVIESTDIATGGLMGGVGLGDVTVSVSGSTVRVTFGDVRDEKRDQLRNFYGFPNQVFNGRFSLTFNTAAMPPAGFSSSSLIEGTIANVKPGCEDHVPAPKGTSCNIDGDLCTIDQCNGVGSCELTSTTTCNDDGNICNGSSACEPDTGQCASHSPPAPGTPCDADGNPCTLDACEGHGGGTCAFQQPRTCADDLNPCNGPETCNPANGACQSGPPEPATTPCNLDGDLCTVDRCNGSGSCVLTTLTTCPNDGQVCNGGESCNPTTGMCVSTGPPGAGTSCEADGNLCTIDVCDGISSCNLQQVQTCTDDGVICNGPETCNPRTGMCASGPPAPATTGCEADGSVCTLEHCSGTGSCIFGSNASPSVSCNDGLFCNGADNCDGNGQCGIHVGDPCPNTPCNGCQESTDTCGDLPGTSCNTDSNLCTVEQCSAPGTCSPVSTTTCPSDGQICNGPEQCNPGTGVCASGPPAHVSTTCEADGNVCTQDHCNGSGVCELLTNVSAGSTCDDGIFCNGTDTCDGSGMCTTHSGDPCLGTQCNTCQELTDTCFDPAGTMCDDGSNTTADDACDGMGMCIGNKFIRDYAILKWPPGDPDDAKIFLRGKSLTHGHVCGDFIGLRKFGVIDGDAVVPRSMGIVMKFSTDSEVKGGLFTSGASIQGLNKVMLGRNPPDTTGMAPEINRCLTASGQATTRWSDFQALPATEGQPFIQVPAHGSLAVPLSVTPIVVLEVGDIRLKPYSTLTLVGNSMIEQVYVRVTGSRGMRCSGRSKIVLQDLQPEQVIFLVDSRIRIGAFVETSGTLFGHDRVFVAGHGVVNGQILGVKRITLNPSAILNRFPFFGW